MQIAIEVRGRRATATLTGEFDLVAAPDVRTKFDELVDAGVRQLIVNLRGVRFLDSSGLGAILATYRRLRDAGGEMVLCAARNNVQAVLELSGIQQLMRVLSSEKEVIS